MRTAVKKVDAAIVNNDSAAATESFADAFSGGEWNAKH
jgi:small subunit ribosomal protein S20